VKSRRPASFPEARRALARLAAYARGTGVEFAPVVRRGGWEALGLPDLRGFVPQLRCVRRFAGQPAAFPRAAAAEEGGLELDDLETSELWLLHDLAHVVWYDLASVTFGPERWARRDFFLEQHLVSEAFAVLLLDYHLLSRTKHRGLAVDLDAREWGRLRRRLPELPSLDSFEMCRELVAHYLSGRSALFRGPLAAGGGDARALARWREHEASYSDKQRWYVFLWWDDLDLAPPSNLRAVVEDEGIAELVWVALRLFTSDPDPAFEAHLNRVAARLRATENLFAPLPKYRRGASDDAAFDFRFTDAQALPRERIASLLERAREPSASSLFLLWQALALSPPDRISDGERRAVESLARSAQTLAPDRAAWDSVRTTCRRIVERATWNAQPLALSAFFLP
jgi:hypothetical protein